MEDRYDVEALLLPPSDVGQVLLVGAGTLVSYAIDDLGFEVEYFVEQAGPDGAGVRCVGVELEDAEVDDVRVRAEAALWALVAETGELAGWGVRIAVVPTSGDDVADGPTGSPTGSAGEGVPDDGIEGAAADLPDDAVDALLPSGDELLQELVHAIEHEQSVYADAAAFRAVPLEDLFPGGLDVLEPAEKGDALRRSHALAGCLIQASVWVVDRLFDDVADVAEAGDVADGTVVQPFEVVDTWILSELPARFAERYSSQFAKEFLVATVDLSGRLTGGWEPMSCVAQELGMRLILNAVAMVADSADVGLPEDWRPHLEQLFFEDLDHEYLYDPEFDLADGDPVGGMAPMGFDDWFTPFNPERTLPPYAL